MLSAKGVILKFVRFHIWIPYSKLFTGSVKRKAYDLETLELENIKPEKTLSPLIRTYKTLKHASKSRIFKGTVKCLPLLSIYSHSLLIYNQMF